MIFLAGPLSMVMKTKSMDRNSSTFAGVDMHGMVDNAAMHVAVEILEIGGLWQFFAQGLKRGGARRAKGVVLQEGVAVPEVDFGDRRFRHVIENI